MSHENAWLELVSLLETMRGYNLEGEDIENLMLCIDYLQSQISEDIAV